MIQRLYKCVIWGLGLAVFVACGVPDSGAPVAVQGRVQEGSETEVNVAIPIPRVGGTPEESIAAFLSAAAVTQNRERLAEEFMTSKAGSSFTNGAGVHVVQIVEGPTLAASSANAATVRMNLIVVAEIDQKGVYEPTARKVEAELELIHKSGLWVLVTPPPSVWIADGDFARAMRPVTLYYSGDNGNSLVPEQRYLDRSIRLDALPTHIVDLLLNGPSSALSSLLPLVLPKGVRLRSNVIVMKDALVVDFSSDIQSASTGQINTFIAQMGWSLRRWRPSSIRILAAGRAINLAGVKKIQTWNDWEKRNPAALEEYKLYAVSGGVVAPVDDDSKESSFDKASGEAAILRASVSRDGRGVAVVRQGAAGEELWIGETKGEMHQALIGRYVSRPSWGRTAQGVLVAVDGVLYRVGIAGAVRVLALNEPLGPIRAVRVAYDGVRVALISGEDGRTAVHVGAVARDGDGGNASFRVLRSLNAPVYTADDIGWAGPVSLVVAGREADEKSSVWQLDVDGSRQIAMPPSDVYFAVVSIASSASEPLAAPLYIEINGRLYRRFRDSWAPTSYGRSPFYAG